MFEWHIADNGKNLDFYLNIFIWINGSVFVFFETTNVKIKNFPKFKSPFYNPNLIYKEKNLKKYLTNKKKKF